MRTLTALPAPGGPDEPSRPNGWVPRHDPRRGIWARRIGPLGHIMEIFPAQAVFGARIRVLLSLLVTVVLVGFPAICPADSVDALYDQARKEYSAALVVSSKDQKVQALKQAASQFKKVLKEDSAGRYRDKAHYMIGQCNHHLYDLTKDRAMQKAAIEQYRTVTQKSPNSPLADDAQYLTAMVYLDDDPSQASLEFAKVGLFYPKGDMKSRAEQKAALLRKTLGCDRGKKSGGEKTGDSAAPPASSGKKVSVATVPPGGGTAGTAGKPAGPSPGTTGASTPPSRATAPPPAPCPNLVRMEKIQHWSGEDYTRVAVYTSGPVGFDEHAIPADPKNNQPGKIYVEVKDCVISPKMKSEIRIMDAFLQEVRAEQCDASLARVVLDTKPIGSYRIFTLSDPSRLIIDVRGGKPKSAAPVVKQIPKATGPSAPSLARQLGLEVKRIVIDPGHGGKDKGAISPNGTYEKDITLAIAFQLKKGIEAKTGCEVILTRTKDRFLSLEERTAIANTSKADLFVSLHTNAHQDRSHYGIETYFLNLSKDKESARVAAFENATSTKKISDLEAILHDLMLNTKLNESSRLASEVHKNLVSGLKPRYTGIRDLGVKQAPFYVLLGAEMPSILIETAFLTNEREEKRLKDKSFQEALAVGIASGIESYIQHMKNYARSGEAS